MNKKGQSTAIFIILIPLLLLALAFIVDNALIIVENNRFASVTKTIMKDVLTNSYSDKESEVGVLYQKNKYETDLLTTSYDGEYLTIYNSHTFSSFFGKLVGHSSYRTEVNYKAHIDENNEVIIEKVDKKE